MRISLTPIAVLSLSLLAGCGPSFQTTRADLDMKTYPAAPGADAVVLERSGHVVLGYTSEVDDAATFKAFGKMGSSASSGKSGAASSRPATGVANSPSDSMKRESAPLVKRFGASSYTMEVGARIKILNEAGLARAEIDDILPPGSKVEEFAAATFLPNGEKIPVPDDAVRVGDGRIHFRMPKAQVGAVLEYHYKFYSKDMSTLTGWTFQAGLPVAKSVYRFKMLSGTNLPFRFVKTGDDQQADPQDKVVLGMDQKQWIELSWGLSKLPARPEQQDRAAVLFGD